MGGAAAADAAADADAGGFLVAFAAVVSPWIFFSVSSEEVNDSESVDCEHTEDQLKVKVITSKPIVQRMMADLWRLLEKMPQKGNTTSKCWDYRTRLNVS